ncbi:MAG: 23S rRNA (adenine2503-C2)-methyltransferase [Polyangiales bacterium]|jgi:23S rRNA (adenine2503-C2)-methyltransferase
MRLEAVPPPEGSSNQRYVAVMDDGSEVEAVVYRDSTLCISSQVGCAVACPFCASGARGLGRALTLEELQFQLEAVEEKGHRIERVTLSGVGEPLHNHEATSAFLEWGRSREARVVTSLTTSGGPITRLRTWLHAPHNGLTISVHAGREATRKAVVPGGPTLEALFDCLREEQSRMTRKRRKKTALAYLMVAGMNDSDDELDAFSERVLALPHPPAIHLYDLNPVPTSALQGVKRARYEAAYARLREHGNVVRMSSAARLEANGGCGTLVALRVEKSATRRARTQTT